MSGRNFDFSTSPVSANTAVIESQRTVTVSANNTKVPKILEKQKVASLTRTRTAFGSSFTINEGPGAKTPAPDTVSRRGRNERKSSRGSVTPCSANQQYANLAQNTLKRSIVRRVRNGANKSAN